MTARSHFPKPTDSPSSPRAAYHRPLIPTALALAGGILVGGSWPGYMPWAALMGIAAFGRVLYAWYCGRRSTLAPLLLMSILGYALISPWLPSVWPADHMGEFENPNARERFHIISSSIALFLNMNQVENATLGASQ